MTDLRFHEAPADFARLAVSGDALQQGLRDRGWLVADVRFGWMAANPSFLVFGDPAPMTEIDVSLQGERFLLLGVIAPALGDIHWQLQGREEVPEGWFARHYLGTDETALPYLDNAFYGRNQRTSGAGFILGDPAAVSIFALTALFVGGILAEGGKDVYAKIKSLSSRSTAFRRIEGSSVNPWVVVHDPEHNCVIEYPRELPPAAAEALIRLRAEEIVRTHLRWNPETQAWDRVDRQPLIADPGAPSD
ncbi:hypothetical protein [Streptomyces acidicola]|uniref:Uncharacterized protein n=1 Tax=Streptomyces acidicola TaxID=2596892 RepID=A0A5N8WKU0_9ACTN|nr:hypothetical protein [Streptomyces acidicola]MPY47098.1 hypothetical protein [Streptomyces acidicola]MPY47237.1 hypothetical protein [Streptomyces acidicola]